MRSRSADAPPTWSTAWATAPTSAAPDRPGGYPGYTFRNVVHTTIGGPLVRLRLTNRFGSRPVRFGHVTVALSGHPGARRDGTAALSDGSAQPGTVTDVHFAGRGDVTVAAGADVLSDPVPLAVPVDADLLVSIWTPEPSGTVTYHRNAKQTSYFTHGPADHAGDVSAAAYAEQTSFWFYVAAVEVTGAPGTIVVLGDSISDGGSSPAGANARWPDYLAARLAAGPQPDYGVANSGISGNRVLLDSASPGSPAASRGGISAQARFGADVLERSGARAVIVLIGINDIMLPPRQADPARITAGLAQIAAQAHAAGLRVIGGTLTPWQGRPSYTPERDAVRMAVNNWIRAGGGGSFDAVADFDRAVRDPMNPMRLRHDYDGGDGLHPNAAGNQALAGAVPLDQL